MTIHKIITVFAFLAGCLFGAVSRDAAADAGCRVRVVAQRKAVVAVQEKVVVRQKVVVETPFIASFLAVPYAYATPQYSVGYSPGTAEVEQLRQRLATLEAQLRTGSRQDKIPAATEDGEPAPKDNRVSGEGLSVLFASQHGCAMCHDAKGEHAAEAKGHYFLSEGKLTDYTKAAAILIRTYLPPENPKAMPRQPKGGSPRLTALSDEEYGVLVEALSK